MDPKTILMILVVAATVISAIGFAYLIKYATGKWPWEL